MEQAPVFYNRADFIETQSGNKVSRKSVLCGSQNIVLQGKTIIESKCIVRGDLANVRIGRQCVIGARTVIRPPGKELQKAEDPVPVYGFLAMQIGEFVTIEEDCVVNAASIGSYVHIGQNCVIGSRSILKDCCKLAEGAVLPPDTVVPPFTLWAGNPARIVAELPECTKDVHRNACRNFYGCFKSHPKGGK